MITPAERQAVYDRLAQRFPEFVAALSDYAAVPTISARQEAAQEGAEATRRILERQGIPARLMDVPGRPHLAAFARQHPGLFRGSAALVEAGSHALDGNAQLFMGNKGILYVELRARTADVDQHSSLAAVIPNPAWRLLAALRTLRNDAGR